MAEDIGNIYKTKIPSYAEAADIQAALKLFHYGTTTVPTTEGEILADSLAGHLKALDTRLDTIESDPARSDFLTQAEMAVSFPTRVNGYISMDPNSNGGSVEELYASAIYSNEPPTVGLVNGLIWVDKDSPALDTYVYDSTSTPSPWVRINDIKKIVQSKGDLLVGSTSADVDNLSVGANGTVLTADDTQTLGVKWQAVSTYSQPTLGSTAIPSGSTISNVNGLTINSTTIPTSKTLVATDSYAYVIPSMSGNSGKYLTNNGDTPSWATLPSSGGGMTLLQTISMAGGVISVTSNPIPNTYKHLLIIGKGLYASGNLDGTIRINGDSGSNYYCGGYNGQGSAISGESGTQTGIPIPTVNPNITGDNASVMITYLYNYASSNCTGTMVSHGVSWTRMRNLAINYLGSAVSTLVFSRSQLDHTYQGGSFQIWGIN